MAVILSRPRPASHQTWHQATQEQRNRLVKILFETIWIKDKRVYAVTPQPEFKPFFDLQYAGKARYKAVVRPRGVPDYEMQIAYLVEVLCPQIRNIDYCRNGIQPGLWKKLTEQRSSRSLRKLAKIYGVSYETLRRVLNKQ